MMKKRISATMLIVMVVAGVTAAIVTENDSFAGSDGPRVPVESNRYVFHVTVWSDGSSTVSKPIRLTRASAERYLDELTEEEEAAEREAREEARIRRKLMREQRNGKVPTTGAQPTASTASAAPAQPAKVRCAAACNDGRQCSRKSKGTTGLCWQHQGQPRRFGG